MFLQLTGILQWHFVAIFMVVLATPFTHEHEGCTVSSKGMFLYTK